LQIFEEVERDCAEAQNVVSFAVERLSYTSTSNQMK
jgi:hypothetical protein